MPAGPSSASREGTARPRTFSAGRRTSPSRNAWKESFHFLGYEFGPLVYRPTRTRYLGARPSKKAMEKVRQRVSEILWLSWLPRPSRPAAWSYAASR